MNEISFNIFLVVGMILAGVLLYYIIKEVLDEINKDD